MGTDACDGAWIGDDSEEKEEESDNETRAVVIRLFGQKLQTLVSILFKQCIFPCYVESEWDDEGFEVFETFRSQVGTTLLYLHSILGSVVPSEIAKFNVDPAETCCCDFTQISTCKCGGSWRCYEAKFYCLSSIAEGLSKNEAEQLLPVLFQCIEQLFSPQSYTAVPPLLIRSIVNFVSAYSMWLSYIPQAVLYSVGVLLKILQNGGTVPFWGSLPQLAADTLSLLVSRKENARAVASQLKNFTDSCLAALNSHTQQSTSYQLRSSVMNSICRAVRELPPSSPLCIEYVSYLFEPLIKELESLKQSISTTSSETTNVNLLLQHQLIVMNLVTNGFKLLDWTQEELLSTPCPIQHPLLSYFERTYTGVFEFVKVVGLSSPLAEEVRKGMASFFRHSLLCLSESSIASLHHVIECLLWIFENTLDSSALSPLGVAAGILKESKMKKWFALLQKQPDPQQINYARQCFSITMERVTAVYCKLLINGSFPHDHPQDVKEVMSLGSQIVSCQPAACFGGISIHHFFEAALRSITATQAAAVTSVFKFLGLFVNHAKIFMDGACLSTLLIPHGVELATMLVSTTSGSLPRSFAPQITSVFIELVRAVPNEFRGWLQTVLSPPDFPYPHITPAHKVQFITSVFTSAPRSSQSLQSVIEQFYCLCRQIP
ncbi:hypothetical protein Pelo_12887 [Pelomyxa schiedti]|nr:hypothetical protein Pelo_12887 [Pelomyxa schiedti]